MMEGVSPLIDRDVRARGELDRPCRASPSGSRSRARSATAPAPCRRSTRRARAGARRRAAAAGRRRARPPRPRTRPACGSTASRTRARRSGRRARRRPRRGAPAFSSSAAVQQRAELLARQLLAGQEVPQGRHRKARILRRVRVRALSLEPLPRTRLPPGPLAVHAALQAAADHRTRRHPRAGQPRPLRRNSRAALATRTGTSPAAGVPAPLGRRPCRELRRPGAPRAHLPQLARPAPRDRRRFNPDLDRLEGGRLEPDPRAGRPRAIAERRDLVTPPRPPRAPRARLHPAPTTAAGPLHREPPRQQRRYAARRGESDSPPPGRSSGRAMRP